VALSGAMLARSTPTRNTVFPVTLIRRVPATKAQKRYTARAASTGSMLEPRPPFASGRFGGISPSRRPFSPAGAVNRGWSLYWQTSIEQNPDLMQLTQRICQLLDTYHFARLLLRQPAMNATIRNGSAQYSICPLLPAFCVDTQQIRRRMARDQRRVGSTRLATPNSAVLFKTGGRGSNVPVTTHSKARPSDPTLESDDAAPAAPAPLLEHTTRTPTQRESACLENECALTDYASALDRLWKQ
jgi:hypothetical protein